MSARRLAAALLLAGLAQGETAADVRYELGVRMRAVEQAIALDGVARAKARPSLEKAVQAFFRVDFVRAARALDGARAAVEREPVPSWAAALAIVPTRRIVDGEALTLAVRLEGFYEVELPAKARLRLALEAGGRPHATQVVRLGALPALVELDLAGVAEGDHVLVATVLDGEEERELRRVAWSRIERFPSRSAALAVASQDLPEGSVRRSLESTLERLDGLAAGPAGETDYPSLAILRDAERAAAAALRGQPAWSAATPGQVWLDLELPGLRGSSPVRLLIPQGLDPARPVPLVIALHGAGGSENLVFDGYGGGAAVALARERGWILVAPRLTILAGPPLPELVEALAAWLPVDRGRVLVFGHSMGAVFGLAALERDPRGFRAFAALGGGRATRKGAAFAHVPVLCSAGEHDFGAAGVRALHASLLAAGVRRVELRIEPDSEHLGMVQAALPAVFGFFDAALAHE